MYDKVAKEIEKLEPIYLNIWEEVCNIESPSDYKEGVDAVGRIFREMAEQRGWQTEVSYQDVAGDVICITMNAEVEKEAIALSGHLDTVHPVGSFGTPVVTMDEEIIYGPGVIDCKGGAVAAFMAMDALHRCGFRKRPVRLLLQTDEEVNSALSEKATIKYICEKAKDSLAFLNAEGFTPEKACIERKGISQYRFIINGVAAHASACSTQGSNAIAEAAHKILELEKFKDAEGITCNCGVIHGGSVVNVVPEQCSFDADVRYFSEKERVIADEQIRKIAARTYIEGCTCKVEEISQRPAMELVEKNVQLLEKMNQIYTEVGLPLLAGEKRTGGSDAAYVTQYGIPCIDSIGVEGGGYHSLNEFAWKDSLAASAKRMAAVICLL